MAPSPTEMSMTMPDLELPVAPSWYMSKSGRPWQLREDNTWYYNSMPMTQSEAHEAAPFTRIDERFITATEALDRASEELHTMSNHQPLQDGKIDEVLDAVRPEFDELFHE